MSKFAVQNNPKFSIIVPIYNTEQWLDKCIQSILNQTYEDFELILVDDGSTDSCSIICDKYSEKDSRVKVVHKKNGGLVSARNAGLMQAKGDYIVYVDGDDWIKQNHLEECAVILERHNGLDMIIFNYEFYYRDGSKKEFDAIAGNEGFYEKKDLEEKIYPFLFPYNNKHRLDASGCNKVFKKDLLQKHYCTEERIVSGEDAAFTFECIYYANNVYFFNKSLYVYNQTNQNSISSNVGNKRKLVLYQYLYQHFVNQPYMLKNQIDAFYVNDIVWCYFVLQRRNNKSYKEIIKLLNKENICFYVPDIRQSKIMQFKTKFCLLCLKNKQWKLIYFLAGIYNRFI